MQHSGDCPEVRAELWSSTNTPIDTDQAPDQPEQCQAEQQSRPNVQQEAAAGEMTKHIKQPLAILMAVVRSVISPISIQKAQVLTSNIPKGYCETDDHLERIVDCQEA